MFVGGAGRKGAAYRELRTLPLHQFDGLLGLGGHVPEVGVERTFVRYPDVDAALLAQPEEPAVDVDAVGLYGVPDPVGVFPEIFVLKVENPAVEGERHQQRLSAVPDEPDGLILFRGEPEDLLERAERDRPGPLLLREMVAVAARTWTLEGGLDEDRNVRFHGITVSNRPAEISWANRSRRR